MRFFLTACFAEKCLFMARDVVKWNPFAVSKVVPDVFWSQVTDVAFDGVISPVLKHGPGSLTCLQVFEWKTH